MKKVSLSLLLAMFCYFTISCDKWTVRDGVWLKMGDGSMVATSEINFYDLSTHMIYLKKKVPYLGKVDQGGTMSVYVDNVEIYKCSFHPTYLSSLPSGAYISNPTLYEKDIVRIDFRQVYNSNNEPSITDPRNDKRIIEALKKNKQYHQGLDCTIQSVDVLNGKVVLDFELYNPDTFNYYHLDPDKMGVGLFHYFTNGPTFLNIQIPNHYTHLETVVKPSPWNSWKIEWLSLIKSGERKTFSITYDHFDHMPEGKYKMFFLYPGLNFGITQKELILESGRIWMGEINIEKDITVKY